MNRIRLKKRTVILYDPPLQTGWYGRPGVGTGTRVHVRIRGQRGPICGARMHRDSEFQWCANSAVLRYIECGNCKRLLTTAPEGK